MKGESMMSMGQKLWEVWRTSMNNQGIDVGGWDEVDEPERAAWEELGETVGRMIAGVE
jgi:hypothetical protein